MKISGTRLYYLVSFLLASLIQVRADTDALADKVSAFSASLEASLASVKPDANAKRDPEAKTLREDQNDPQLQVARRALTQLKMLEAAIRRDDLNTIQQITGGLNSYDMLPQSPGKWNDFMTEISAEISERSKKSDEQWYADVQKLAKASRDACLAAKHSADLDDILMHTAKLQMKRVNRENIIMQRGMDMINGIVYSLKNWARYLDQRDAGNRNAANEILRNFNRGSSDFPVLSADDIRSKLLPGEVEPTFKNQISEILTGLKTLEDLPAVIERWKEFQAAPGISTGDMSQMAAMNPKLDLLLKASSELKAGNDSEALVLANDPSLMTGSSDMIPYLKPLINQVVERVLATKIEALIGPQPAFASNPGKAINEALAALKQKGDYQGLLELLKLQQGRQPGSAITAIEHYLAAKRFESSGDIMMAISEYRPVVAAPAGPLAPQTEAVEALQRLEKENPYAFKDSNGVLLQEIRTLREQLNLQRGMRYPGGRNY